MDRSFTLPIVIATAAHSALFLTGEATRKGTPPPALPALTVWEDQVLPPPEPEEVEISRDAGSRGPENPPPIRRPDVPDPNLDPDRIWQEVDDSSRIQVTNPTFDRISPDWTTHVVNAGRGHGRPVPMLGLDNKPAARFQPAPAYPADLRASCLEGRVTVSFSVDTEGRVCDAEVVSANHPAFGEQALSAVRKWRFEPGVKDNMRVPFRMVQAFQFTLSE